MGDLDVLIRPALDNAARLLAAVAAFGVPITELSPAAIADHHHPATVFAGTRGSRSANDAPHGRSSSTSAPPCAYETTTSRLKSMTDAKDQVTTYTYFLDDQAQGHVVHERADRHTARQLHGTTERRLVHNGRSVLTDTRRQREWLAQWRRAGAALEQVRADALAHLRSADALAASETLLAVGASMPLPTSRITWSGLIDFQRQLHGN